MGLFGLFVSLIGLGAVTKDAISDDIYKSKNKERAKKNGDLYYSGSGSKIYSTKTGRRASIDYSGKHTILRDFRTGEALEDLTVIKQKELTDKAKEEARHKNSVFYLDYTYEREKFAGHRTDVYVSSKYPGFFAKRNAVCNGSDIKIPVYERGELEKFSYYRVIIDGRKPVETYFEDGTPYSDEEMVKRVNLRSAIKATLAGYAFHECIPYKNDIIKTSYYKYRGPKELHKKIFEYNLRYKGYQQVTINSYGYTEFINGAAVYDLCGNLIKEGK